ncbi:hypothetical protein jhhlp_005565 [Lomentospora prolificans]|uniref:NADP-dependent oxidoreductase domain-containing protein n=1 Tax=Lomentospora prolificans TaxID=41688 RepID=A0A2N3N3H2_9PEZI|nr:hypothetical protein jhhlp_005565 [Lomentospora prolificans]
MAGTSPLTRPLTLQGGPQTTIPRLIYGTAWKKSQTKPLVQAALSAGFRAIDTAAQPRHYQEHLVGDGLRAALQSGSLSSRSAVYIQSKYTPTSGQDLDDLPYDPDAELEDQVKQSVESSLRNFTVNADEAYLDCLVLHSPLSTVADTLRVWRAMATYVPHKVRNLGISNVPLPVLRALCAEIKKDGALPAPAVVQNRMRMGQYQPDLYAFCRDEGIVFQSFWTLTANPNLLRSEAVTAVADGAGVGAPAALYSVLMGLERFTVLDGTTSEEHMKEDLEGIEKVGVWAEGEGKSIFEDSVAQLRQAIGYTS